MAKPKVVINADAFYVRGPKKTDGSYTFGFETGEYESMNVAKLLAVPHDSVLKVTVEVLKL